MAAGIGVKPAQDGFLSVKCAISAQTSGAGLQAPISTIIQHQVNSPDKQNLAWVTEGKCKTFY